MKTQILNYIRAGYPALPGQPRDQRVEAELKALADEADYNLSSGPSFPAWSKRKPEDPPAQEPIEALQTIESLRRSP